MATAATMAPTAPIESTLPSTTAPAPAAPNTSNIAGPENHASNLLIAKMAAVLRNMDYDNDAIKKVSSRAAANTIEGSNFLAEDLPDGGDSVDRLIGAVDAELLDETKLRQKGVYLNSNEPVLLLEVNEELGLQRSQIHEFKEGLLNVLRWNRVKPVRVYVRRRESEQSDGHGGVGVAVTLLNVVNTDIGGPGMVQLLDAAFHGEGWKEELVVKEAWNGYDLLWRDEAWDDDAVVERRQEVVEARSAESQADDTAAAVDAPGVAQLEDRREQASTSQYRDVNAVPEDEEEVEPEAVEHPAMKELREREAQRSGVEHPTWSRTMGGDPGVLDVITTQSSSAKDTDPISVIAGRTNESSDDGFEVVEKT